MPVATIPHGLLNSTARGYFRLVFLLTAVMASLVLACPAAASERAAITISTAKPLGPALGTFSTVGAFPDFGTLVTVNRTVSALPAPFGVVTHLVPRFEGNRARSRSDLNHRDGHRRPAYFLQSGRLGHRRRNRCLLYSSWNRNMQGTVNDAENLITRLYTGTPST
jgi:hypothetical protein